MNLLETLDLLERVNIAVGQDMTHKSFLETIEKLVEVIENGKAKN